MVIKKIMIIPKKIKFKKVHENNSSFKKVQNISLCKSQFGIKSLTSSFLSEQQLNMILKSLNKKLKRNSKIYLRTICSIPVTKKPLETRMGKGKGAFHFWKLSIKAGQILFEIQNTNLNIMKSIERSLNKKLALRLKTVFFFVK